MKSSSDDEPVQYTLIKHDGPSNGHEFTADFETFKKWIEEDRVQPEDEIYIGDIESRKYAKEHAFYLKLKPSENAKHHAKYFLWGIAFGAIPLLWWPLIFIIPMHILGVKSATKIWKESFMDKSSSERVAIVCGFFLGLFIVFPLLVSPFFVAFA